MTTHPKTLMEPVRAWAAFKDDHSKYIGDECVREAAYEVFKVAAASKSSAMRITEQLNCDAWETLEEREGAFAIPVTITDARPEAVAEMIERAASSLVSYDADAKWPDDFSVKDVAEARRMASKCFAEFFGFYPDAPEV